MTQEELIAALQDRVDDLENTLSAIDAPDIPTVWGVPRSSCRRAVMVFWAYELNGTRSCQIRAASNDGVGDTVAWSINFGTREELIKAISNLSGDAWCALFPPSTEAP